jgi:membrane protease YdiL (CAAX protease family)
MTASNSSKRRGVLYFGLFLSLVVPVSGLGGAALHIPGVPPLAGQEAFFWSLATLVLLFILKVERRPLSSVGFRRPDWKTLAAGIGGGLFVLAFAGSVVFFVLPLFHLQQDPSAIKRMLAIPYWYRVAIVTRAAFVEELLMRGYGIERLEELTGSKVTAGAVTLIFFTLGHISYRSLAQLFAAAAAGLVLTILYIWRRDLTANMIAHWVTDGSTLLLR